MSSTAVRAWCLAVGFLTRLPAPSSFLRERDFPWALVCFPLVGVLLSGLAAVVALGLDRLTALPPPAVAVVVVTSLAVLTGGTHLGGVADLFNAAGGVDEDRRGVADLLRDSPGAAQGVTALVLVVAAKVTMLSSLVANPSWLLPLVLMATPSRALLALLLTTLPYAREQTRGATLRRYARWWHGVGIVSAATLVSTGACWLVPTWSPEQLVAAWGATTAVALALALWIWRRLGGMSADASSAVVELGEVAWLAGWLSAGASG